MELGKAIEVVVDIRSEDTWIDEVEEAMDTLIAHARRSLEAPKASAQEPRAIGNLPEAMRIAAEIERIHFVVTELKSAFARRELHGGPRAPYSHPLHIEARNRLDELHEQLMVLI